MRKARTVTLGEMDEMALVGALSTQLWHEAFVSGFAFRRDAAWRVLAASGEVVRVTVDGVFPVNLSATPTHGAPVVSGAPI